VVFEKLEQSYNCPLFNNRKEKARKISQGSNFSHHFEWNFESTHFATCFFHFEDISIMLDEMGLKLTKSIG